MRAMSSTRRRHVREYRCYVSPLTSTIASRIPSTDLKRLRRNIKWKRNPSFVYVNNVVETGKLVISNAPLEERDDLVGCYFGSVSSEQLREDIIGALA